jgi:uncharacterized membrane protein
MNTTNHGITTALATLLALGLASAGAPVLAADPGTEKCAGIVKGGQNDCATSMNACHGHVSSDAHPEAWIYLPQGSCEKIIGGRITNQKAPDEASADKPGFGSQGRRAPFRRFG